MIELILYRDFAISKMERKIIKNSSIPRKRYIITLIKVFISIQNELRKITYFDHNCFLPLETIDQAALRKGCAERQIKKEYQIKLFQETYEEIVKVNKKQYRSRRSDLVIKFTMVTDILKERLKQQLCINGQAKQILFQKFNNLKHSFLSWGKSEVQNKHLFNNKEINKKETNDYKLKYIFSQLATTNVSGNNSRSISRYQNRDNYDLKQNIPSSSALEEVNLKMNLKSKEKRQRHTVTYVASGLPQRRPKSAVKNYTKKITVTDYDKNQQIEYLKNQNQLNDQQIHQTVRKPTKKRTNFREKEFQNIYFNTEKTKQNLTQQILFDEQFSPEDDTKKSAYYASQNYIRSRKNIQNITLFVNINNIKTRKRIESLSDCKEDSLQCPSDMIFLEHSEGFKSRKFITRKNLGDSETFHQAAIKSYKSIPRSSLLNKKPQINNQKKQLSKFHKDFKPEIQEIHLEPPPIFLRKQFTSIRENGVDIPQDTKGVQITNNDGKAFAQFYTQLGGIRNQFKKNQQSSNKSTFFHQQGIIWQDQKKRMQKLLQQRYGQLYFRQFQMPYTTSHRDEMQALQASRNDLFALAQKTLIKNFFEQKLGQVELCKYQI